jgi:hypothetical protein
LLFRLSEVGETGSSGAGGSSRGLSGQSFLNDYEQARQVEADVLNAGNAIGGITDRDVPIVLPLAIIGGGVDFLVNFFEDIFGGGESPPPIPRQLRHHRHPLYSVILGIPEGLIPDEVSGGRPPVCGDPWLCPTRPLADDKVLEIPQASTPTPTPRPTPTWDEIQQHIAQLRANGEDSRSIELYLEQVDGLPKSLAYPLSLPGAYVPHDYQAIPTPEPGPILPE